MDGAGQGAKTAEAGDRRAQSREGGPPRPRPRSKAQALPSGPLAPRRSGSRRSLTGRGSYLALRPLWTPG